ncbi:MAG: Uma2 family endonuclease [Planctomycetota bacterium]
MAVVPTEQEARVLLPGVSWSTYEAILADVDAPGTRLTYDRGDLEIMSPSDEHERFKRLIGRMIEALTEELEIPIRSSGSTTFKSEPKRRGFEPDESYYLANEPRIRGRDEIDLSVDPPPDLVVEVEITRGVIDRMPIYAALGVPEVWRYDGATLRVEQLQADGTYAPTERSAALPMVTLADMQRFLDERNSTDETSWIRSFRAVVRAWRERPSGSAAG